MESQGSAEKYPFTFGFLSQTRERLSYAPTREILCMTMTQRRQME